MERAVLKTLVYANIFNYPLKAWEIHKWLIGKKVTLRQVENAIKRLEKKGKIKNKSDYYFLKGRSGLAKKRELKLKDSKKLFRSGKLIGVCMKIVPWIKLIGISGNVAMENATRADDVDFFIVTTKDRLWLTRMSVLGILNFLGKRRMRGEVNPAGKICVNILVEEDNLVQQFKDVYTAHEVLQMRVLWQRENIYSKFLMDNEWVFKFLPNWTSAVFSTRGPVARQPHSKKSFAHPTSSHSLRGLDGAPRLAPPLVDLLERASRFIQLRYMGKPSGKERINEGALYFHPNDYREKILKKYNEALAKQR